MRVDVGRTVGDDDEVEMTRPFTAVEEGNGWSPVIEPATEACLWDSIHASAMIAAGVTGLDGVTNEDSDCSTDGCTARLSELRERVPWRRGEGDDGTRSEGTVVRESVTANGVGAKMP